MHRDRALFSTCAHTEQTHAHNSAHTVCTHRRHLDGSPAPKKPWPPAAHEYGGSKAKAPPPGSCCKSAENTECTAAPGDPQVQVCGRTETRATGAQARPTSSSTRSHAQRVLPASLNQVECFSALFQPRLFQLTPPGPGHCPCVENALKPGPTSDSPHRAACEGGNSRDGHAGEGMQQTSLLQVACWKTGCPGVWENPSMAAGKDVAGHPPCGVTATHLPWYLAPRSCGRGGAMGTPGGKATTPET